MTPPEDRDVMICDFLDAVEAAEQRALADHQAGVCHPSEWSCSHCEAAALVAEERAW